jgi:4-hydroxy-2-oxoheptanedioate aldolase
VLVRPEFGNTVLIKRLLDIGAQTLLFPMVESAEQAEMLVAATRYPPAGVRGVAASVNRVSRWGRIDGYFTKADDEMCVICQIETVAGMAAIEEIAAVEGVDALLVGPSDLGASLGLIGQGRHPHVLAAVDDSIARIVATGKPAGDSVPWRGCSGRVFTSDN